MRLGAVVLSTLLAAGTLAHAQPKPTPPLELREGTWFSRGPKTVVGSGSDSLLELRKAKDGWTVTFTQFHYPRVGTQKPPTRTTRGPYPVEADGNTLVFTRDGKKVTLTARFDDAGALWCPALVQTDDRTWTYKGERGSVTLRTEHPPAQVPVGKAEFPASSSKHSQFFYSYEVLRGKKPVTVLRFLMRDREQPLSTQCKLVWNEPGTPRFEGSGWYGVGEMYYAKPTAAEQKRLDAIDESK